MTRVAGAEPSMAAREVVRVLDAFAGEGMTAWLEGGWAVPVSAPGPRPGAQVPSGC
jgi:hypothetical protein